MEEEIKKFEEEVSMIGQHILALLYILSHKDKIESDFAHILVNHSKTKHLLLTFFLVYS